MNFSRNQLINLSTFLILTMASCNSGPNKDNSAYTTDELMAAAKELDSLYLVAFNNGDVDGLMKLHWDHPELRTYPPGEMQLSGFDAVKKSYIKDFAANQGAMIEYTSTNNIPFSDGVAGYGTYRWVKPVEGGSPIVMEGRYSDIKAYKDGKMLIIHDHSSMPMAPPPAEDIKVDTVGQN